MDKILIVLYLVFAGGWNLNQAEKISSFSYETYTRGYRKTILIRPDSTFIREQNQPGSAIKRKTSPADWTSLLNAVAEYKLSELINLPAPSNNRARDAARSSTITIHTNRKKYLSGSFDDQKPHLKLEKLMKIISQISGS